MKQLEKNKVLLLVAVTVGRPGVERSGLSLGDLLDFAKQLAG